MSLHNDNWISNLAEISTTSDLEEFTLLFMTLSLVFLINLPDSITWKWIKDIIYTVAFAYLYCSLALM
jgi:hypothetical protein